MRTSFIKPPLSCSLNASLRKKSTNNLELVTNQEVFQKYEIAELRPKIWRGRRIKLNYTNKSKTLEKQKKNIYIEL